MLRIETKYFSYCSVSSILWLNKTKAPPRPSAMKSNILFKSLTAAAAFTAVFFGFVKFATGLPLAELSVAYVATLAIIGLAAADDAHRAA